MTLARQNIIVPVVITNSLRSQTGFEVEIPGISVTLKSKTGTLADGLLLAEKKINDYVVEHGVTEQLTVPVSRTSNTVSLIAIDVDHALAKRETLSVKRSVTIPRYLVEAGHDAHLNFSRILTEALKARLSQLDS